MSVDNVTFQTNNVVGNFNYPPNVPAYKPIMKFLLYCPLNKDFTNCPLVLYQNYFKEVWSTVVAYDPFSSTDETEQRPLTEFLIKFSLLNGQRLLTIDFNTFCSSTGLDYNNGKYVAHPTPKAVKKELGKITINPSYMDKTPVLKNSYPVAWRMLFTFVIQDREAFKALSKKCKKPKSKKTHAETKATSTPKPTEGFEQSYSVSSSTVPDPQDPKRNIQLADMAKTTPRPEGSLGDKDSGEKKPPADMKPINPTVVDPSGTGAKYQEKLNTQPLVLSTYAVVRAFLLSNDEAQESEEDILEAGEEMNEDPQAAAIQHQSSPPEAEKSQSSHAPSTEASDTDSSCDVNYANLKASIDEYYDENIAHRDETDKLIEAFMSFLDKINTTMRDLYKGLNVITELVKKINNAVKDDLVINKKINESTESFTKISTNITEVLSLVKGFNFSDLQLFLKMLVKLMLSNKMKSKLLGPNFLPTWHGILVPDFQTLMTEMYEVFKGQSSGSFTPTLALTHIPANVEGENATNTATEDPPSHTEGETDENRQEKPDEFKHLTDANIEFIGSSKPQPSIT
nr:retrovirus-related Pol polyprotein from transposon TNT 1-94 [Tanacetum cinerariifolium]